MSVLAVLTTSNCPAAVQCPVSGAHSARGGSAAPCLFFFPPPPPVKSQVLSMHAPDENRFGSGSAQYRPRYLLT